jgi:hypothetical protein
MNKLKLITIFCMMSFIMNLMSLPSFSWSTYTHGAIAIDSLKNNPNFDAKIAFFSSMPDITTNFFSPSSKDKFYSIFHGDDFFNVMKTLYSSEKLDDNAKNNILGYLTHVISDEVAHGKTGYPNKKVTFKVKTSMNHYTAYLFMDMLLYCDFFKDASSEYGSLVPDLDFDLVKTSLAIYSDRTGENINFDEADLHKKLALFRASIGIEKAIFDTIIDDNPELFEEIRTFYSDYRFGVDGVGGFLDSILHTKEKLNNQTISRTDKLDLSDFFNEIDTALYKTGYEITSFISRNSDIIRYGKLTSTGLNSIVDKLFASKSEKSVLSEFDCEYNQYSPSTKCGNWGKCEFDIMLSQWDPNSIRF